MLQPRLVENGVSTLFAEFLFSPLAVLQPAGSVFITQTGGAVGLISWALLLVHCQHVFHDTASESTVPAVSLCLDSQHTLARVV